MKIYFSNELPKSLSLTNDDFFSPRKQLDVVGESALIYVTGMLEAEAPGVFEKIGIGTTYDTLVKEIKSLPENIEEVVFMIDSCGGSVKHLKETAQLIKELGEHVSTVAYVTGQCASAAYYIASACNHIIMTDSAQCGCIGTLCVVEETQDNNYKVIVSKGADFKVRTEDNKEDYDQYLQERVNKLSDEFKNFVLANRNIENKDEAFNGKMFLAEDCVKLGLADEILSITKINIK